MPSSIFMDVTSILGTSLVILLLVLLLVKLAKPLPKFTAGQKKWWMVAHIFGILVYFCGVLSSLLLVLSIPFFGKGELVYPAHLYVQYLDWFVIIPGALTSLLTGFWISLRTNWGLAKYHWIVVKWAGNISAILFGSTYMRRWIHESAPKSPTTAIPPFQDATYLHSWKMLLIGSIISISILIFLVIVSYIKPWGKRRLGETRISDSAE